MACLPLAEGTKEVAATWVAMTTVTQGVGTGAWA